MNKILGTVIVLTFGVGAAIQVLNPAVPATVTPIVTTTNQQPVAEPVKKERSQDEVNTWAAGMYGVWLDYCITPDTTHEQIDAVQSTITSYGMRYGTEAIKAAYDDHYFNGYYKVGKSWCPRANSFIRSHMR